MPFMPPQETTPILTTQQLIAYGVGGGILSALLLIVLVFATGQTFGQRCAKSHAPHSAQWDACVQRLINDGTVEIQ